MMTREDWILTGLIMVSLGFGVIMGVVEWGPNDVIKLLIAAGLAGTGLILLGVTQ